MKKALALILSVLMVVSVAAFGSFSVAAETTTLIESGADWDYYYVLGEETLPEGWYEVGFDTSDWELGATPFTGTAYANENANTQIDAQGEKLTAAFVTTFTVEDASALQVMTMGLFYDENPVVYINGTEVFTASNWNNSIANFDLTDAIDTLVDGENTIAVYMENAVNGGGFHMDLTLEAGTPDVVDADGNVTVKEATKTGFADFGGVNAASNILDGVVGSCSGSARNKDTEQSWTVTFWANIAVSEIYLQTKGKEDNTQTTHEDGITYGYYNVYVGDTLVAENVPAISEVDGGYTVELETPVAASSVKVELTGEWLSTNWANLADIAVKGEVAEDDVTPPEPALPELAIKPYASGDIKGFENWPASDLQTNLLIRAPKATGDFRNNTWVLTINGEEYEMTVASVGAIGDDYIYRFQVCLADDQFIPVVGTEYTISAEIYDGETLVATTTESAGFIPHQEPIVPTTPEPPVDPVDPPVGPGEGDDDEPGQTGDAAVYATIAVAVAAVALAVVFKRRSTI